MSKDLKGTYDEPVQDAEMAASSSSSTAQPSKKANEASRHSVIIRATDGSSSKSKKAKLSTLVVTDASQDGDERARAFFDEYASLVKGQLANRLRPKRKKKPLAPGATSTSAASASTKSAALRKGALVRRLPKVIGPRRGAGVEKRRRAVRKRQRAFDRLMERERRKKHQQQADS